MPERASPGSGRARSRASRGRATRGRTPVPGSRGGAGTGALATLLVLATLAAPAAPGLPAAAACLPQDASATAVAEAFAAGHLGRALELAADLGDPLLAAEWRFHVLYSGGDLPAALEAVAAGLARDPDHPALLENGARCALALGDGHRARRHAEVLAAATEDTAVRARAEALLAEAQAAVELEEQARAGLFRARAVASALGAVAAVLMVWFARRSRA